MRTTLQIDDDVLQVARSLAQNEKTTLGQVISRLARKGLRPVGQERKVDGFPVFDVSQGSPRITPEMVRRADEEST